ncbi:MAG: hypothetical protein DRP45_09050, partial [Candidatus Zixiibacteriota bacterium]
HANGTHYKKSVAAGNKITSMIHLSCESSSGDAVVLESVDATSVTVLNGELRGCDSNGVVIDEPSGNVFFNNLYIDGQDTASTWGILCDDVGAIKGDVKIANFDGGAWIKKISTGGSMGFLINALTGTEAGVRLGDFSNTTHVQRFAIRHGSSIVSAGTNGVHLDYALGCVVNLGFVSGATNDILFDNNSANCTVVTNGRNVTFSKYTDNGTDNKLVFDGESLATFTDGDATPSVLGYSSFLTNTTGVTITRFDYGYPGQVITIVSKGAIVFDTTTATRLIGSSVDITTAAGDVTQWVCEVAGTTASVWRLVGFVDVSADNSGGA